MPRISISPRKRSWIFFGRLLGLGVVLQDLAHALGGTEGALKLGDELRELHEGGRDHAAEAGKLRQFLFADLAPKFSMRMANHVTRIRPR
jgi:hypothetical protein